MTLLQLCPLLPSEYEDGRAVCDCLSLKIVDAVDLVVAPANDNVVGKDSAFFGGRAFFNSPNDCAVVSCCAVDRHFAVVFDVFNGDIAEVLLYTFGNLFGFAKGGQNGRVGNGAKRGVAYAELRGEVFEALNKGICRNVVAFGGEVNIASMQTEAPS